jgi:hypothetical protein
LSYAFFFGGETVSFRKVLAHRFDFKSFRVRGDLQSGPQLLNLCKNHVKPLREKVFCPHA